MTRPATIALLLLLAALTASEAQQRPPSSDDSKACAPGDRLTPGVEGPNAPKAQAQTTGESLSDKLARTDGVLCPPNVDPGIRAPTPDGGTMPVIPPPGSPGGDPSVRPK